MHPAAALAPDCLPPAAAPPPGGWPPAACCPPAPPPGGTCFPPPSAPSPTCPWLARWAKIGTSSSGSSTPGRPLASVALRRPLRAPPLVSDRPLPCLPVRRWPVGAPAAVPAPLASTERLPLLALARVAASTPATTAPSPVVAASSSSPASSSDSSELFESACILDRLLSGRSRLSKSSESSASLQLALAFFALKARRGWRDGTVIKPSGSDSSESSVESSSHTPCASGLASRKWSPIYSGWSANSLVTLGGTPAFFNVPRRSFFPSSSPNRYAAVNQAICPTTLCTPRPPLLVLWLISPI